MNVLLFLLFLTPLAFAKSYTLDARANLDRLIQLDKNQDKKITVDDGIPARQIFELKLLKGKPIPVQGTYHLSNLLQELKLATEDTILPDVISANLITENPVDRISRLIRELYWDSLTRKIDEAHLKTVLPDSKFRASTNYLYVPAGDSEAFTYFQSIQKKDTSLNMTVEKLPEDLTELEGKHGLLSLKIGAPYVVPGGRFNEMYGWDSYFESLGLILDGRLDLARGMVDNMVYEIQHYGKILNANRTYYLGRSQPPFLTSMIREVYAATPKKDRSLKWLAASLKAAIKEYNEIWVGKDRLTETGLSRYFGTSKEVPPEVEPGHYNHVFKPYADKKNLSLKQFEELYRKNKIDEPELDKFFINDQAVRESGHDTTYRWLKKGKDSCADFATIDLNSLLYKVELDISFLIKTYFKGNFDEVRSEDFQKKAARRKELIRKYLWDSKGMFFDYDVVDKTRSAYISATAFYPLWAHESGDRSTHILNQEEAVLLVTNLLQELEAPGGLASTSLKSLKDIGGKISERQWDYPNGWAPHQMLAWKGLRQYGLSHLADRLTYKWLYMITKNAMDYNGTIPEKYDVVARTHKVFAEYGNVGTKFSYITREGFGWMNASYQVGLKSLPLDLRKRLRSMAPPEGL